MLGIYALYSCDVHVMLLSFMQKNVAGCVGCVAVSMFGLARILCCVFWPPYNFVGKKREREREREDVKVGR